MVRAVGPGLVTFRDQYSKAWPAGMKQVISERIPAYSASKTE